MAKSDPAVSPSIAIQQGDWSAYRAHIQAQHEADVGLAATLASSSAVADSHPHPYGAHELAAGVSARVSTSALGDGNAPKSETDIHPEGDLPAVDDDLLEYRRRCAQAYIGMNGRLGGRAYRANEPVILTPDTVNELAELNRLLREERAAAKRST
ncbi:hypothetical protein PQR62_17715 [Herbaspirillum lusitanum]|uniref:Uncharacterized protein n=1 Tax=Herbaspirillum lusitanum TaxID=213312 RepID=A0ABW9AB48_9BURK